MLSPRNTPGASVTRLIPPISRTGTFGVGVQNGGTGAAQGGTGWRLEIPAGPAGTYRLAQLDNYHKRFPLSTPTTLSLHCRTSSSLLPGTWGFGFWNDPFTVSFGLQGTARRLPALPNAAWFFHASAENHLSFRGDLPASGFLAQTFSSPKIPSLLLAPGLLALPLMVSKTLAKRIRAIAGKIIREDAKRLELDVTQWHAYRLMWSATRVEFAIDGEPVFETESSPKGPLGLVIWIDNQFAAFTPDGKFRTGTQANPAPAWMEIADLEIS